MLKRYPLVAALVFSGLSVAAASAQSVIKETLPGVTNFSKLETTIACAAATTAQAGGLNCPLPPFNGAMPDPAVADKFIIAVTDKKTQPAFVHCASANRAAAMWMIKRLVVDKWEADRAGTEAAALGLTNSALRSEE